MKKTKKGVTLIELIIVLAIMSVVLLMIYSVCTSTFKINNYITDKIELQESATSIQRSMYNDIRRSNRIVDGIFDASLNRWVFDGSNMEQNNAYCRLKGYKPLIYFETIMNNRAYYVYDAVKGEVRKVIIPNDGTTTTVTVYFTKFLEYDGTNLGTEWDVIPEENIEYYSPPNINYDITDEVSLSGLVIKYDYTSDEVENPVTFNDFTKMGAFIKKDNVGNETGRFVVVKTNTMTSDGKYLWFVMPIKSEELVYYTRTADTLVSKYVVKNGTEDGIRIIKNSSTGEGDTLKGYYDIELDLKKKNLTKKFHFRISTVDYGGDIK